METDIFSGDFARYGQLWVRFRSPLDSTPDNQGQSRRPIKGSELSKPQLATAAGVTGEFQQL